MALEFLSGSVKCGVNPTIRKTIDGVETEAAQSSAGDMAYAIGANLDNKADAIYMAIGKTIAAGATLTLDLAGGAVTNQLNENIAMAKIKMLYVRNRSTNVVTSIKVGGNANGPLIFSTAASFISVKNSGCLLINAPLAAGHVGVVAATGDILDIVNQDGVNAALVDIILIGSSS